MLEQDTARELISDASKKLTEALQQDQGNVQLVKVAQVMLSAGNEKLNAAAKQLADIRLQKDKLCQKLHQQQGKVENAETSAVAVPTPPTKKKLYQMNCYFAMGTQAEMASGPSGSSCGPDYFQQDSGLHIICRCCDINTIIQ